MSTSSKLPDKPPNGNRQTLRGALVARRLAVPAATIAAWGSLVCRHLLERFPLPPGRHVGFCWPVKNEPDMRPVLATWRADGAVACLPVIVASDAPLAFRPWSPGTPTVTDRYGIPTPAAGEYVVPDVLLLPLNAFDATGYRIGYGGGYFDRTLATITPRPLAIGVGFEIGRVDAIVAEAHDQRLDWIVTEAGCFRPHLAAPPSQAEHRDQAEDRR